MIEFFYICPLIVCKHANEIRRKIVTVSDGNVSVEVKLWGELSTTCFEEGSTVKITCLHVDLYQNRRTLNSSESTSVQVNITFAK